MEPEWKKWKDSCKRLAELKDKANDALEELNEHLGEMESLRFEIEEKINNEIDEHYPEDHPDFDKMAHIHNLWCDFGIESCVTEIMPDEEQTMDAADELPFPDGWAYIPPEPRRSVEIE